MKKLIMWNMITLDGYFEGSKKWDIAWHEYVWGDELEKFSIEQFRDIGMLVFGRVTYEGMASYWSTASGETARLMNSIPKVVFSRTLKGADWNNTRLVKDNAVEEIPKLKREPGKDIYIFGSANLSASLMEHGLIDEYRLGLNPILLGKGNPLFKPGQDETKMKLVEARPMKSGVVILRYQPDRQN